MRLLERLIIPDEIPSENQGGFDNARERDQCVIAHKIGENLSILSQTDKL
jgi:hypothetical protein